MTTAIRLSNLRLFLSIAIVGFIFILVAPEKPLFSASCPSTTDAANETDFNTAIEVYNATSAACVFTLNLTANIELTGSTRPIDNAGNTILLIQGNGNAVNGNGTGRPIQIDRGTVSMNNITIKGGYASDYGAGIDNEDVPIPNQWHNH